MADKKPTFPSRPCPKCGKPIHIKSRSHEACGWSADAKAVVAPAAARRSGKWRKRRARTTAATSAGGIRLQDIAAVKALVDQIGAAKVRDLATVLTR